MFSEPISYGGLIKLNINLNNLENYGIYIDNDIICEIK